MNHIFADGIARSHTFRFVDTEFIPAGNPLEAFLQNTHGTGTGIPRETGRLPIDRDDLIPVVVHLDTEMVKIILQPRHYTTS